MASGVRRAACAGVLLFIHHSIRERWCGDVGVARVDGFEGEGMGEGSKFGGLGWGGSGGCIIIGGGFSAVGSGWSGVSILVLALGVSITVLGGLVDVLTLVGGGEEGAEWGGGKGKGIAIGISCCGIGIGASLAELFL